MEGATWFISYPGIARREWLTYAGTKFEKFGIDATPATLPRRQSARMQQG
jgi:hypothetical protein